ERAHDLAAVVEPNHVGEAGGCEPDDHVAIAREILEEDAVIAREPAEPRGEEEHRATRSAGLPWRCDTRVDLQRSSGARHGGAELRGERFDAAGLPHGREYGLELGIRRGLGRIPDPDRDLTWSCAVSRIAA